MKCWSLSWLLLVLACSEPNDSQLRLLRLGEPHGIALDSAFAAAVSLDSKNDTLFGWDGSLGQWTAAGGQLRTGDAGEIQLKGRWHAFVVNRIWSKAEWEQDGLRSTSDSLWLAGNYGSHAQRLSEGSGCWCHELSNDGSSTLMIGDVVEVTLTQHAERQNPTGQKYSMVIRWGDEDQLMAPFWRCLDRWGAPAQWKIVCPSKEAFGEEGVPSLGLPPKTPVHFQAEILRLDSFINQSGTNRAVY